MKVLGSGKIRKIQTQLFSVISVDARIFPVPSVVKVSFTLFSPVIDSI
jgi:hypothetical protein